LPLADRRDQLIAAAISIAARDGIEAATVRAVAVEAGVSAGVVHYCFSDKNELLTCMAEAITELNTPRLPGQDDADEPEEGAETDTRAESSAESRDGTDAEDLAPDGGPDNVGTEPAEPAVTEMPDLPQGPIPVDLVLTDLLSTMWSSLESTPGYQLLTYELTVTALRSAELDGVAQAQYRAQHAAAAGVLDYAAELAAVRWTRPQEDLARIVVASIDGAALAWLVDKDAEAAKRTLGSTVELLSGYAAPAEP
jgi:AcrR family transcriptional regulator